MNTLNYSTLDICTWPYQGEHIGEEFALIGDVLGERWATDAMFILLGKAFRMRGSRKIIKLRFSDKPGLVMGRRWWAGRPGPAHHFSMEWTATRPGPSLFCLVGRGPAGPGPSYSLKMGCHPARPIIFSEDGARLGPASQFFRGWPAARPSPSSFNFSWPGPAQPINFSNVSARRGRPMIFAARPMRHGVYTGRPAISCGPARGFEGPAHGWAHVLPRTKRCTLTFLLFFIDYFSWSLHNW